MTTLPNDPPVDDDDWSHEVVEQEAEPSDPDNLDAYSDEELEAFAEEDADDAIGVSRVTYPGEDVDDDDEL